MLPWVPLQPQHGKEARDACAANHAPSTNLVSRADQQLCGNITAQASILDEAGRGLSMHTLLQADVTALYSALVLRLWPQCNRETAPRKKFPASTSDVEGTGPVLPEAARETPVPKYWHVAGGGAVNTRCSRGISSITEPVPPEGGMGERSTKYCVMRPKTTVQLTLSASSLKALERRCCGVA